MDVDVPIQAINQIAAANITSICKLYRRIGIGCEQYAYWPASG